MDRQAKEDAILLGVLMAKRSRIERALRATHERELLPLRIQLRELELRMSETRRIPDLSGKWIPTPPLPAWTRPPTLHVAIQQVLEDNGNSPLPTWHIADEIARRGLYHRRDGLPPTTRDVSARVRTYPALFVRKGWAITLRSWPISSRDLAYIVPAASDPIQRDPGSP